MKNKFAHAFLTISLAIVLCVIPCMTTALNSTNTKEVLQQTRTIEASSESVDYESILNEFEDAKLETEGTLTIFEGIQTINLVDLEGLDEISKSNLEDETAIIKYAFSYDEETNLVTLTAVLIGDDNQPIIDTISGSAFLNESGQIDAVMNIEGEGILLSEMQNAGMIQNCGWFSNLIKKVVKVVAIAAATIAVVATVAAVVVATAGAAAPAVVAAGVGVAAGGSAAATALASTCLTVAMVSAGISLAATAVATIDFQGVEYELKEYSKVAEELIKGFYYLAVGDSEGRMLVAPVRLSTIAVAASAMGMGLSVYSPDPAEAYAVAQLAGGGALPVLDPAHKDGYFAHYHVCGRPKPASHAFYGVPTSKGSYA